MQQQVALDIFHYQVAEYIARCMVAMNGMDILTFTAGVGEKGQDSREAICEYFEFLGLKIDKEFNQTIKGKEAEITAKDSKIRVFVVPTNEELMIARQTLKLVNA